MGATDELNSDLPIRPTVNLGTMAEGRPEARNLVGIMAALEDRSIDSVLGQYGGSQFGPFKTALADLLVATLGPIRTRFENLRDTAEIDAILAKGADRASALAAPTLAKAYAAMGLAT